MLFIRCLNFVDFLFVRVYEGMVCNNGEAAEGVQPLGIISSKGGEGKTGRG